MKIFEDPRSNNGLVDALMRRPLIGHAHFLQGSLARMEEAMSMLVRDIQLNPLAEYSGEVGGAFFHEIHGRMTGAMYLEVGQPVEVSYWHSDCFSIILPLTGRARLEQYPPGQETLGSPFFVLPGNDMNWQLSADCSLLVVRFSAEGEAEQRLRKAFQEGVQGSFRKGVHRLMQALPQRLHLACPAERMGRELDLLRKHILELSECGDGEDKESRLQSFCFETDSRVERAMEYLTRIPADAYNLDQLSEVAHMSQRGLYYAFRRNLGCTPYWYLKACRLVRVRIALLLDTERHHPISWHAAHEGFRHMSRFAAQYRTLFGELPRETHGR